MKKELVDLKINGRSRELAIEPSKLLLDALRQDLQLTGSKRGCDDSSCGACTVDRKSTRLNSSHQIISYAVFCLKSWSNAVTSYLSLHDALPIYVGRNMD